MRPRARAGPGRKRPCVGQGAALGVCGWVAGQHLACSLPPTHPALRLDRACLRACSGRSHCVGRVQGGV